ncbi:glycosyltransferase family 61 protein [Teichococcus cervicalis]|uniref:Glycosyltransferase 61 catalytic domain-containing protein n=1 Tax=Pseudoroseomonas cervicalis ATCC 49957 TaxID=525371 RepID=D5RLI6_9PROT|nr:glycosyltransferase family 61 protein [Pseudoroseomonas cervicalis]EFH11829.1 hypothetical protein HMPREF0731_1947 [Pseudoroseomonas cervicalis ATCC 49957]
MLPESCALAGLHDLPLLEDLPALLAAPRGRLDLAPAVAPPWQPFATFRQGAAPVALGRMPQRFGNALRLGVYSEAVILGGGAVVDSTDGRMVVESFASASDSGLAVPQRLEGALSLLGLRLENEKIHPRRPWRRPARRIEGPLLHLTYRPDLNYTHFMLEVLPRLYHWLLFPEPRPRLLVSEHVAARLAPLLALYGVRPEHLVPVGGPGAPPVVAERLYLGSAPLWKHEAPLQALRGAADRFPAGGRRIRIQRRGAKLWFRNLLNEAEVAALLDRLGFESVALEDFSLSEQVALFRSAECVAGVYGGGLFNTLFCRAGTRVLSLTSPDYHRFVLDSLPPPLALRGATVVGESFTMRLDANNSPFVVDMDAVRAACAALEL